MLTVKELSALAGSLSREKFTQQLGPFVLVQRPPGADAQEGTDPFGLPVNAAATRMARADDVSQGTLGLLFEFERLAVATLPPMSGGDELTVGRLPDCDLVVDDGSVSKRHAVLRWDSEQRRCTIRDLGSTNGTLLNASTLVRREIPLRDGDIVSFGDAPFWYLLTETLYAKLSKASESSVRLRSYSG